MRLSMCESSSSKQSPSLFSRKPTASSISTAPFTLEPRGVVSERTYREVSAREMSSTFAPST